MQPPRLPNPRAKRKAMDKLAAEMKRLEHRFWLGTALSFLALLSGGALIVYAPLGDPKIIAFGLLLAVCGAVSWAVLKIITYFKVAVMFMLRQEERKEEDQQLRE